MKIYMYVTNDKYELPIVMADSVKELAKQVNDMERLTKYGNTTHENGVCCTHFMSRECKEVAGNCANGCKWEEEAWSKLAHYEDLEEQGLLLKLPCKVGDTVYIVGTKCLADEEPFEDWCDKHDCEECILDKTYTVFERYVSSHLLYTIVAEIDRNFIWGETVFLTKAEAEKALAEMEK